MVSLPPAVGGPLRAQDPVMVVMLSEMALCSRRTRRGLRPPRLRAGHRAQMQEVGQPLADLETGFVICSRAELCSSVSTEEKKSSRQALNV